MKLTERECDKDELLTEIRRYAGLKRLERSSANAMDVDAVARNHRKAHVEPLRNPQGQSGTKAWPWIHACQEHEQESTEEWEQDMWSMPHDPWGEWNPQPEEWKWIG